MRNAKHVIHGVSFMILHHHSRYPVIDDVHSLAGRFHGIASNQLLNGQLCVTLLITQAQQKFEYVGMRLSYDMAHSTVPSLQTVGGTWLVRYSTVVHTPHSRRELGRFPYNGEPRATHDSSLSADVSPLEVLGDWLCVVANCGTKLIKCGTDVVGRLVQLSFCSRGQTPH